jgi:hypothetical protein
MYTHSKIIGTFTGSIMGVILVFGERWSPSSGIIASYGVFDFDHVCSICCDLSVHTLVRGTLRIFEMAYPKSPRIWVQYGWLFCSVSGSPVIACQYLHRPTLWSCRGPECLLMAGFPELELLSSTDAIARPILVHSWLSSIHCAARDSAVSRKSPYYH